MGVFLYNLFLLLYGVSVSIVSLFSNKARKWLKGRRDIFKELEKAIPKNEKIIWMHCASLGEFEQGRPLIEKIRSQATGHKILLTFFSPSGYDIQKNYKQADWVFYLPMDGSRNATRFLEIVNPSLVIFVKYDFWYYYLKRTKQRKTPLLLISALFKKEKPSLKWYGGLMRKMLSFFDHLFVQNQESKNVLDEMGLAENCSVSGDTRFDRVIEIAGNSQGIPLIEQFIAGGKAIVAGSTWKEDEEVLQKAFDPVNDKSLKLIIAPHEINEAHIKELKKLFSKSVLFSELSSGRPQVIAGNILIIDNIGMLSRLYRHAYITYVGGAFKKNGIHNVLEPAVYGKPVLFGPYFKKHAETIDLVNNGGAVSISNADDCSKTIQSLLQNKEEYEMRSGKSLNYVRSNMGATKKIMEYIQRNRLLTS